MSAQATRALQLKIRRIVWTGAIASVTAMGAWYGAGLKIQSEEKKIMKERLEATPAEKIKLLEQQRIELLTKRHGIEKKIRQLEMRGAGATRAESMAGMERKRGE
ncbi:hypothetical protein GLAREA_02373 [Glarea lozoyensis ATCC 20868]|uniref:Uncharacterized protein n=2 Tax=Glarea lozoyensis TaxID=101852 RepID=S3CL21_GLAL2|nr:uncharacterized protein GLAREA_02373 [Glarea lozoyensis ATCC 20868]EHL00999.1 hypothetical protein M7I_3026 [Glarea lozoyensis 74030]EPE26460.1 hypothetical protein GLAREA_02373 [Glarea lozoyensis ATCC 20868]